MINNNGRFSEETRKKVEKVISETGYETNDVAKSLRMQKSNTIGILIPDISSSFFSKVVKKIEAFLFSKGYSTIICNTDRNADKENAYLRMLEGKMIDGLIVISGVKAFGLDSMSKNIPVVCIDREPRDKETILIESNHFQGAFLATEAMIQKGSRKIAIIVQREYLSSSRDRINGYCQALEDYSLPFSQEQIIRLPDVIEPSRTELAKAALLARFKKGQRFDGAFAINDRLAIGAVQAALENGLTIPSEFRVMGFDNDSISKYCQPKLSTINQDSTGIAEKASQALLSLIETPTKKVARHQVIDVELIVRETI